MILGKDIMVVKSNCTLALGVTKYHFLFFVVSQSGNNTKDKNSSSRLPIGLTLKINHIEFRRVGQYRKCHKPALDTLDCTSEFRRSPSVHSNQISRRNN